MNPRHMFQVGNRGPFNCLQRAEVPQQRALASRADAGDFLQARLADVLLALLAVRSDREAMRLVAQPLHEVKNRVARPQLDRLSSRNEEGPSARLPPRA